MDLITRRTRELERWSALKNERSNLDVEYREIARYLAPRAGRFDVSDRNRSKQSRYANILDSTGTRALGVLVAGLQAGIASPARPWFRTTTGDPDLAEFAPVKEWLARVTSLMLEVFQRSNTYRALASVYKEVGAFGTAANVMVQDFDDVVLHYPLTVGEYAIATNARGRVDTLYREFQMPVGALVGEFGLSSVSTTVRNLYHANKLDAWVTLVHKIEPRRNDQRDLYKRDNLNMPFASCYFETGTNEGKYLRESGFEDFPAMAPRWEVTGRDIYGEGCGAVALGHIKQLQQQSLRKAQGIDYKVKPPLQVPNTLKDSPIDTLPGGVAFVETTGQQNAIRSLWDVNLDMSHLLEDIQDVRGQIRESFFADLFVMIASDPRNERATAAEIAARQEEKLTMLGPVLERLHNELLSPLIDLTFTYLLQAGLLPTPPQELQNQDLKVEFVSMLAQAQRAIGINSIDRLVTTIGQVAAAKGDPSVWDKLDTDEVVDKYADMLGVDPALIVADDRVALVRRARAEAQQEAAQQQQAAQAAETAAKLGTIDTSGDNAFTDVTRAFSGYT